MEEHDGEGLPEEEAVIMQGGDTRTNGQINNRAPNVRDAIVHEINEDASVESDIHIDEDDMDDDDDEGEGHVEHGAPDLGDNGNWVAPWLRGDNHGEHPDVRFFREFLQHLRNNDCTEMYRYYVSRQERLITIMVRDARKAATFCQAAEGNVSLKSLHLDVSHRYTPEERTADNTNWMGDDEYYRRWELIGRGIGKLQGLEELQIHAGGFIHNQNTPDLIALAHILRGASQIERAVLTCDIMDGDNLEFAFGFRNHANLKRIDFRGYFDQAPMDAMARQLITVPNLTRIDVMNCFSRDIPSRMIPDPFMGVLQKPSLVTATLQRCSFTEQQCEMLAQNLLNNTSLQSIDFQYSRFLGNGAAFIAASLAQNETLEKLQLTIKSLNEPSCQTLADTLLRNETLKYLNLEAEEETWASDIPSFDSSWLDPIFVALQTNSSIRSLHVAELDSWNATTAEKFRAALESPTTAITDLWVKSVGDASGPWGRIVPALAGNRTLQNLKLLAAVGHEGVISTARVLATNTTLTSLEAYPCSRNVCGRCDHHHVLRHESSDSINNNNGVGGEANADKSDNKSRKNEVQKQDCISALTVEALGQNATLKRLMVDTCISHHTKDVSELGCKCLIKALKGNFGLQGDDMAWGRGRSYKRQMDVYARLNKAGRRYLLTNPADRVMGTQVLGEVHDSVDCLFTHLKENPAICSGQ